MIEETVDGGWPWYLQEATYREQLRLLREYEGWRCLWRASVDVLLRVLPAILAVIGAVASAYIVNLSRPATVVLGACVAIGLDRGGSAWRQRHGVQLLVPARLWGWEHAAGGDGTEVPLLINDADAERVTHLLRASQLSPGGCVHSPVPADAPWGDTRMIVRLPLASRNEEPLVNQVKRSLSAAGIRGRVCGEEVLDAPKQR